MKRKAVERLLDDRDREFRLVASEWMGKYEEIVERLEVIEKRVNANNHAVSVLDDLRRADVAEESERMAVIEKRAGVLEREWSESFKRLAAVEEQGHKTNGRSLQCACDVAMLIEKAHDFRANLSKLNREMVDVKAAIETSPEPTKISGQVFNGGKKKAPKKKAPKKKPARSGVKKPATPARSTPRAK